MLFSRYEGFKHTTEKLEKIFVIYIREKTLISLKNLKN